MDKSKVIALLEAAALGGLAVAVVKGQALIADGSLSAQDWASIAQAFGFAFLGKLLPINIFGKSEAK